jgi:plastocyanin
MSTDARHRSASEHRTPRRRATSGAVLCAVIGALAAALSPALVHSQAPPRVGRAGTIRGRVEVRRPAVPTERRPNVADLGTPAAVRDLSDRLTSVVYLESAPRAATTAAAPGRAVLDQRDERFVPHVLAITTGTVVDFPNSDRIYHNVFSLSKTRPFDLGRYAAGRSKSIKFDRPGVVRVFCDIHSHMNAFILVFDHPYFSLTDADGRYRIDNVPPGSYSLVAWNEGVSSDPLPVTVPDGGEAELDFALR